MSKRRKSPAAASKQQTLSSDGGARSPLAGTPVTTGKVDPLKAKIASKQEKFERIAAGVPGAMFREAGMMMSTSPNATGTWGSGSLPAFRTSYASGNSMVGGGTTDIPPYFQVMNDKNGGLIYWPVSLREKYEWYRYWARCFTNPNVMITREDGTEAPLCSFKKGDRVINGIGGVTEVSEVTTQKYEGAVVRLDVEANRWNDIETTPEHPFFVLRSENVCRHHNRITDEDGVEHRKTSVEINFLPEWVEAKDIRVGDMLIVPSTSKSFESVMSVERARLVGYYAAEGNVNFDRNGEPEAVTWSLGTHEDDLIEEIKSLCVTELGCVPSTYNYPERESCTSLRVWDREFAKWVVENCGVGSHSKKFSRLIFEADDETVRHIVGCWLNGDGNRDDAEAEGQVDGTTCSFDMANQLFLMMVRVGLAPAKRVKDVTVFGCGEKSGNKACRIFLPPMFANKIVEYFKWDGCVKSHRHRKYNHDGNMLLPVRGIKLREFSGVIWNLSTSGSSYEERTFLVHGMVTHNTDAFIGRGLELLADLPMSRISLNMPKMEKKPKKLRDEIYAFFTGMCENIGLFRRLQENLWEYNLIGNVYIYHEWNSKRKMWERIVTLPPEEVSVFQYPFQDNSRIEYRPEALIRLVQAADSGNMEGDQISQDIYAGIPKDVADMIREQGCVVFDSTPIIDGKVGSFVFHMARRRSPYLDLGASVLERVLVPMLMKEHFRYTQLGLASRNMTPKNKVSAPGLTQDEIEDLRLQMDLSYMDPDYSIVTNYEWDWEQIGSGDRLLDLQAEYEGIENQVFAALGVTRELMTGEGSWSGNRVTIEIINTMFLLTREMLREYVENYLFRPVAIANKWYDEDKNGVREYWYPKLGFNRLSIRDNAEVFDSLFQLYQKGSLPVDVIYELFNLDSDSLHEKMRNEVFTIKDSTFNRLLETVNGDIGSKIVEGTDVFGRVVDYLGLKQVEGQGEDQGGGESGGFDMSGEGDGGEEAVPEEPAAEEPAAEEGGDASSEEPTQGEGSDEDEDEGGFDLSSLGDILLDDGSSEEAK